MKARLAATAALALLAASPVSAHRLDEYLQATTIAVEKGRIQAEIRLAPGVAVFPLVFADIDRDADGALSGAEQQAYAQRVLGDLSLSVDGRRLPLHLISSTFAEKDALAQGLGEIRLQFEADLPERARTRKLAFENRHQTRTGAYLVNTLVPDDPDIRVTAQRRSFDQSHYELDYTDAGAVASVPLLNVSPDAWGWTGSAVIVLIAGLALIGRRKSTIEAKDCPERSEA